MSRKTTLLTFLGVALLVVSPVHGDANAEISTCDTITYSANPQYPPYHWATKTGSFEGASIELLKQVVPAGVKLKAVVYPWKRSLAMVQQGEIDLLLSLRNTAERSKYLTFTTHQAFPNPTVIFVRTDKTFAYWKWGDLKGRKGVISLGDKFGGGFDEYWQKELSIQETGTMNENFKRLDNGQIDYFITGQFNGTSFLKSSRANHSITYLTPPISDEGIYFGFSTKSPCSTLVNHIDRQLAELEKKDVPRKLLKKYLDGTRP
jgi:polar amino acid transport system substrate-binding protein